MKMATSQYNLSCDDYRNLVFKGFSHLQQEEEFVDLTIAADGHLVRVHKSIVAVASPYLKEMLKTAPCQSPVIFLNNVSHNVLKYLIEYIYQGEVNVPEDFIDEFVKTLKSLHINGLDSIHNAFSTEDNNTPIIPVEPIATEPITIEPSSLPSFERSDLAAHITINDINNPVIEVQKLPLIIDDIAIDTPELNELLVIQSQPQKVDEKMQDVELDNNAIDISNVSLNNKQDYELSVQVNSLDSNADETPLNIDEINPDDLKNMAQYSITERGATQLILNRFIYCCQFESRHGHKRRWRCIDYRRSKCPAFVETNDEAIVKRKGVHTHAFHDSKIHKKHIKGLIFQTRECVENYRKTLKLEHRITITAEPQLTLAKLKNRPEQT